MMGCSSVTEDDGFQPTEMAARGRPQTVRETPDRVFEFDIYC